MFVVIGLGIVAAGGAAFMTLQEATGPERYGRNSAYGSRMAAAPPTGLAIALGAVGLVSAGTGIAVLLTRPDPSAPKLGVGVAPGRVLLSGTIP